MDDSLPSSTSQNPHSISSLTKRQASVIKGHLIDSCNTSYGIFPSFSPLNQEFSPGSRIIDIFPDRFSFNLVTKNENEKTTKSKHKNLITWFSSTLHHPIQLSSYQMLASKTTSLYLYRTSISLISRSQRLYIMPCL